MKREDEKERERRGGAVFWLPWRSSQAVWLFSRAFEAKSLAVILLAGFASGGWLAYKTARVGEPTPPPPTDSGSPSGAEAEPGTRSSWPAYEAERSALIPGSRGASRRGVASGRVTVRGGGRPLSGSLDAQAEGGPGSAPSFGGGAGDGARTASSDASSVDGEGSVGGAPDATGGGSVGGGAPRAAAAGRSGASAQGLAPAGLDRNPRARLDATRLLASARRSPSSAMGQLMRAERSSRAGGAASDPEDARGAEARAFETGGAGPVTLLTPFPSAGPAAGPGAAPLEPAPQPGRAPPVGREKDATPYWSLLASARTLLGLADFFLLGAASASALGDQARAKKLVKGATAIAMIVVGIGIGLADQYGQVQHGRLLMAASAAAAAAGAVALSTGRHQPLALALGAAASGALLIIDMLLQGKV